jgi:hypothetical protein
MDREEASRALELLRTVVGQARDDTAMQNWGTIWIVHAFTNAGGFIATNLLLLHGFSARLTYVVMWAGIIGFNLGAIALLKSRRAGARTFVENQIWAIWSTFIGATALTALVNDLMGLPRFGLGPVIAILSAVGFASMGAVIGRRWWIGCAVFAAAAMAMAALPRWQFAILGVVWGVAQLAGGIWLSVERRKRLASGAPLARVV